MAAVSVAAVDLGASSGRTVLGRVSPDGADFTELTRFPNDAVTVGGTLHWDILSLYRGVLEGLRTAVRDGGVDSVGIDTWAVDYGLLDATGALLGNPVHYRDPRTDGMIDKVLDRVPAADIYGVTGLQFLPINTLYQLAAAEESPQLEMADRLLLIPDLLAYWLTGVDIAEVTNASTTQLLDVRRRSWAVELMDRLDIDRALFPALREPGDRIGDLLPAVKDEVGAGTGPLPVIAVGSHDTASAVVGVPATTAAFAYISCGTWSLVGVELDSPVLSDASREANFTNELGVDQTVRYLRNVMGLWLLQECQRTWQRDGEADDLADLLDAAVEVPAFTCLVDADDPSFLAPGDMPARIADAAAATGQRPPRDRAETVRCILDSLALAYRRTVRQAQELSGRDVEVVHIVGGGSRNALLCQLTADACGLPVVAGPAEATAMGNVLVQARALGAAPSDLAGLRRLLRSTQRLGEYAPSGTGDDWRSAERRLAAVR